MIECGRRSVSDRGTLAHIASALAMPPYALGIAGHDDADVASILAFGTSVVRLADVARHSGQAAEAVSELWPLITRLEARIFAGRAETAMMRLLAEARVSLGVALGDLLPEERLATAARWTGRALRIGWDLGDGELLALVLRRHGNELRKAGYAAAGIVRLKQSLQIDDQPARKGAGLVLLARAAAEAGQADLLDTIADQCVRVLRSAPGQEVLFNAFTVREVRLRGLIATGRTRRAIDLAESFTADDEPPTPQWRVIERITTADMLARAGDERVAASMLAAAASDAETLRRPHQVQRIIRLTGRPGTLTGYPARDQALAAYCKGLRCAAFITSRK